MLRKRHKNAVMIPMLEKHKYKTFKSLDLFQNLYAQS